MPPETPAPTEYRAPLPKPTPDNQPFWDACKRHELHIQRCRSCQTALFYPRNLCTSCGSADLEWFRASGRGKLLTFTIIHRGLKFTPLPLPYVLAIVQLEEGPHMMSNLVGIEPDPAKVVCDMPVVVEFADVTPEVTLPRFRPAS